MTLRTLSTFILFGLLLIACKDKERKQVESTSSESARPDLGPYSLSLAQWSFHRALQSGEMSHLDFAAKAGEMGFTGVEYVSGFFADKAEDVAFLNLMTENAKKAGVEQLLIMVDGEGDLGVQDVEARHQAVQNHVKWIKAAKHLGCHSIRVNAFGEGSKEEQMAAMSNALEQLGDIGKEHNVHILVENHGGYSSDGKWLANVISKVGHSHVGTLPDFGNFCVKREDGKRWGSPCIEEYDRYKGVELLTPFAKAVSAKSYDFDEEGNETTIDYAMMIDILKEYGYSGYIGVEYEGGRLGEEEGIKATKQLLEKHLMY